MKNWRFYSAVLLSATIVSATAVAQDKKDKDNKNSKKKQEIVIRKKGGETEKTTIVVDGDEVTINGKPAEDMKDADVTVITRDGDDFFGHPEFRTFIDKDRIGDIERINEFMPAGINKAMLGVMTAKADDGVRITEVTKESGAEKAGLQKEDVITKVGAVQITDSKSLTEAIGKYKPNDKVDITYKRNGKEGKVTATLGENKARSFSYRMNEDGIDFPPGVPEPPTYNFTWNRKPKIGLQIQDLEEGKGVKVKDVDDETPASKAGLKEGDVITQVNGIDIDGVDALRAEIKNLKEGDTLKMTYKRDGKTQVTDVKIPKRLKTVDL